MSGLGVVARKMSFDLRNRFLPPADITCQTKNGTMTFSSKDRSIGKRLYARREWSWDLLQEIPALLQDRGLLKSTNDLLINVGANIGCILVPLVKSGLFKQGVGFEPSPLNGRYLLRNIEQNGLDERVRAFPIGLSDHAGSAEFELAAHNMGDHRVRSGAPVATDPSSPFGEASREVIQVELARLDDVMVEHGYASTAVGLIWVDIQGHEGHFLKGAAETLKGGVPVVLELWPYGIRRSGMTADEFCGLVTELCTAFYRKREGQWVREPMSAFRALYDDYDMGIDGTDVILVSR